MSDKTSITVLGPQGEPGNIYWTVEVIERPEGDWIVTKFEGVDAEARARVYAEFLQSTISSTAVDTHEAALRTVRDAIQMLFSTTANMPSVEATGPTPTDQAEEIVAALQRIAAEMKSMQETLSSTP